MDGIYLIDKPEGFSSYDCIRIIKKIFLTRKVGHSGTLDPFTSGLLVVLVGKATKFTEYFINEDKEYVGRISFGKSTDTYDKTGEVTEEKKEFHLTDEMINETFKHFQGSIMQTPPIYSAIEYQGLKLYQYARYNIDVEIAEREVFINEFKPIGKLKDNKLDFLASVSKGTYVRSLAYDFGRKLNIPAHLESLRRTKSGFFDVKDAYQIADLSSDIKPSVTIDEFAERFKKIVVLPYLERHILNGIHLDERQATVDEIISVYNEDDELLAIYKPIGEGKYKPLLIVKE